MQEVTRSLRVANRPERKMGARNNTTSIIRKGFRNGSKKNASIWRMLASG